MKWQPRTTLATASHAYLSPILVTNSNNRKSFSLSLQVLKESQNIDTEALIDSGAEGEFADHKFIKENRFPLIPLGSPIKAYNVDGTENIGGRIKYYTWVTISLGDHRVPTRFLVTNLQKNHLILGLSWLKKYNPRIDWEKGTLDIKEIHMRKHLGTLLRRSFEKTRMGCLGTNTFNYQATIEEEPEENTNFTPKLPPWEDGPILMREDEFEDEFLTIQNLYPEDLEDSY